MSTTPTRRPSIHPPKSPCRKKSRTNLFNRPKFPRTNIRRLFGKKGFQLQREFWQRCAREKTAWPMDSMFGELTIFWLPVNFDLLFGAEDEPAFLHTRRGVSAKFRAVVIVTRHAHLDDQF